MTRAYERAREWTCALPSCGKVFIRRPGKIKDPGRCYCSQLCAKRGPSEAALPPDARAQVAERYLGGEQTGELAKEFGVSGSAIRAALKERGITPDRTRSGQASWARRTNVPPDEGDLETGFRWCGTCKERKPMAEFYWASKGGARPANRLRQCKSCRHAKRPTGEARKAARRKHAYGLTSEEFSRLLLQQNNRCAVCREPLDENKARAILVDHCHFDGQVRGLLCVRCNSGLGHFRDDPDIMKAAIEYLYEGNHWHPPLELNDSWFHRGPAEFYRAPKVAA